MTWTNQSKYVGQTSSIYDADKIYDDPSYTYEGYRFTVFTDQSDNSSSYSNQSKNATSFSNQSRN